MILTSDNYYSPEADREYMSCSQYQDFLRCEAATMAKMHSLYIPEETDAMLVGNYVHTALESDEAHEEWVQAHQDKIFKMSTNKRTGEVTITGKYAPFVMADKIIQTFISDPTLQKFILMPGEAEKILTGELFGMPWKIRLDKYIPASRMIIDYKTAADLTRTEWNPETGERESFIEALGYLMRAAIYSEIEKQNSGTSEDPPFVILAVSKQDPPDKGAYLLNHRQRYDYELERVKERMARIRAVKSGHVKPTRCGHCEWCRKTKQLSAVIPYYSIKPGFKDEREEEYDDIWTSYMERASV